MLTFKEFCENRELLCQKCKGRPAAEGYHFCYRCLDATKQAMKSNFLPRTKNLNYTRGILDDEDEQDDEEDVMQRFTNQRLNDLRPDRYPASAYFNTTKIGVSRRRR